MENQKIEIVGIQFKGAGKIYYFSPLDYKFKQGDFVVVETVRGLEMGKIVIPNKFVPESEVEYESIYSFVLVFFIRNPMAFLYG